MYDVRLVADKGLEFLAEEMEFCEQDDVVTVTKLAINKVPAGQ